MWCAGPTVTAYSSRSYSFVIRPPLPRSRQLIAKSTDDADWKLAGDKVLAGPPVFSLSTGISPSHLFPATSDKVETLVDTVASTPAAVGDGLGKAKEAVSSAGEVLESIPRTVEEIPVQVRACRLVGAPSMVALSFHVVL